MSGTLTRHVIIDIGMSTLEGFIEHDTDLDSRFRMELEDGDTVFVNGWMIDSIEDVDPGRSCCNGCGCTGCQPYEELEAIAGMVRSTPVAWGMA